MCVCWRLLCISVGLRSVCVCVRDCYAFHSVCVMPPVKLACARGSGIRSERRGSDRSDRVQTSSQRKDDHLLDHLLKTPTRGDSQSSVPLRILRKDLDSEKYLVIFLVCYNKYLGSDPNRSSFIDCNNPLNPPLELSIID